MPKDRFSKVSRSGEPEEVRTMFCKIALAAATVILVAGCGTVDDQSSKTSGSGETSGSSTAVKSSPPEADIKSFRNLGYDHVRGSVRYRQVPPVGGDHAPIWQNCGFYSEPVRDETAVHSMEHGAVWITYRPGLSAEQVDRLRELANSNNYVLVSLYPDLPTRVVASAWGKQLRLDSAEDPRLEQFVSTFQRGPQTPEPDSPCRGGTNKTAS